MSGTATAVFPKALACSALRVLTCVTADPAEVVVARSGSSFGCLSAGSALLPV